MTIEDFRERRALRGRESIGQTSPDGYLTIGKERVYVGQQRFTPTELTRAQQALERWNRHTVEIQRRPMSVEDEISDLEERWMNAKYAWMFMFGIALGYVLGRFVAPWVFGG